MPPRVLTDRAPEVVIAGRLAAAGGGDVSGEELGAELGISRAAVCRWVTTLRAQGFVIDARTRRGYRMAAAPESLVAARVLPSLVTRRLGRRYLWLPSCGSTNDVAAELARAGEAEGLVVVADAQTGGRGRLGRSWYSPPGANLHVSVLLRPPLPPVEIPPFALLAGAALAQALGALGARSRVKWPNDVLLPTSDGPRKVAGVLTEMVSEMDRVRHVVVGIGVNVNTAAFPPELADKATSLRLTLGREVDRAALLADLLGALDSAYDRLLVEGTSVAVALWRPHADLGRRCRVQAPGGEVDGIAEDVDPDGALRVRDDSGRIHRVLSGEVVDSRAP